MAFYEGLTVMEIVEEASAMEARLQARIAAQKDALDTLADLVVAVRRDGCGQCVEALAKNHL